MKTFIKISMLMLMMFSIGFSESLQAQSPQKMSYQAVIRDGSDNLITSSNVGMRIQILQGSEFGAAVYVETHTPTTNANGLVSIQVGAGNVVSGDFTNIDWANGSYYIKNEIDPTGGTNYSITGISQLLSVPYALHAANASSSENGIADGNANGNTLFWDGNDWIENNLFYNDGSQVGIGNTNPEASFHVGGSFAEDGILVTGTFGQGQDLSISGSGTRMLFYPKKSAFRAGRVTGNQWDNAQIGNYSLAFGVDTEASGQESTAWGSNTEASSIRSTAWGLSTEASGQEATVWGFTTKASGLGSTAWGNDTEASGQESTAWGENVKAKSRNETALGSYNTDYTPNAPLSFNPDDRLFGIGNGTSNADRSDAMVVLKNGKTGIGLSNPQFDLAVSVSAGTSNGEGIALVTSSSNWNIDIDFVGDFAFNYNNNNVSYISGLSGAYVQTSDRSLKENIQPITQNVLDKLQQINVVQYNYKRDKTKTQTTGVIAQELKELFPDFVHHDSKDGKMGLNYAGLSLVAIQGIQEQQQQIDKLEAENKEQQDQMKDQQEQMDELRASNKALQEKVDRILKLIDEN